MSGPDFPPSVDPSAGGYPAPPSGDPPPPETGDPPPGLYALLCFFVIVFRPDSGVVFPVGAVLGVLAVVFGGVGLSRSKTRGGAGRDMAMGGCMLEMLTVVVLPVAFYVDALANWSGGGL
jgi:hypothetical protein